MGSSLGPHWHSDRASSTEKIKKKIQVRYIHPLKITYLSPGAKYTLRRLFPWVLCAACMIQNPPPYRASFRARIRGLCSWISCKYRQRCPMGRSSMSWFFFFFSSHTCHILSAKGEIKGRLSPKKRGRNVLIYPALELFIKARSAQQPTEPPSPFAFLTSIYILFITYSTLEPQSLGCGQNKCACRRSLSARLGLGYLSCRDSLRGYFWRLGKIVCFPLKQWAGSVWRGHGNFGSCLPLCIWRFSQN